MEIVAEWFKRKNDQIKNLIEEELNYDDNKEKFLKNEAEVRSIIEFENPQNFISEKVKINYSKFHFGFSKSRNVIIIVFLLLTAIQGIFYLILRPYKTQLKNIMRVFTLASETSSVVSLINLYMLETLLYNNSLNGWRGMSSLETYEYLTEHFRENIVENYTNILDLDIGNYQQIYKKKIIEVKLKI